MKTLLLAASLSALVFNATAQKVDLDKFNFEVEYLDLPQHYIAPDARTYYTSVVLSPMAQDFISADEAANRVGIRGFAEQQGKVSVNIDLNIGDLIFDKSEVKRRVEEKKDKNGKVTSTSYYYSVMSQYTSNGRYSITGIKNPYVTEKAAEKDEKKGKKKNDSPNPFLAQEAQTTGTAETTNTAQIHDGRSMGGMLYNTTAEYNSYDEAERNFRVAMQDIKRRLYTDFINNLLNTANGRVNALYGYSTVKEAYHLWILDSKSHPEYELQQNAIKAIKEIMGRMQADNSIEKVGQDLKPVMEYFESLKTKYAGDDKREKKMRYSAYFNLAKLYLVLDNPDKAIEQANGLIKNDYDTSDGEELIAKAEELKRQLAFHHMADRHNHR